MLVIETRWGRTPPQQDVMPTTSAFASDQRSSGLEYTTPYRWLFVENLVDVRHTSSADAGASVRRPVGRFVGLGRPGVGHFMVFFPFTMALQACTRIFIAFKPRNLFWKRTSTPPDAVPEQMTN
jgi:hypothetical protein